MSHGAYGSFVLMLHSHLPYYRKAGKWPFGEENLFECMIETYIPLLNALNELVDEGYLPKITVGITPVLAEQLADTYLHEQFLEYVAVRLQASHDDVARFSESTLPDAKQRLNLAEYYVKLFRQVRDDFEHRYGRDLIAAFRSLQDRGAIEITTSGATHGFTPLLGRDESIYGQFKVGVENYKRHFGRAPRGCWLPECAYRPAKTVDADGATQERPAVDAFLAENELQYFFTEYTAVEAADTGTQTRWGIYQNLTHQPVHLAQNTLPEGYSTYQPYWLPTSPVAVMARNHRAGFQVWSADYGYPGDGLYREFHKKDEESGLHYWRLTDKDTGIGNKALYNPEWAFHQAEEHAHHFVDLCHSLLRDFHRKYRRHGLLMVSFDTELYGHWWFEGVHWLKTVLKGLHQHPHIAVQTAGEYLAEHPPQQVIDLPESSWGQGGHYYVWENEQTQWMWPDIHRAENTMADLRTQYGTSDDPFVQDVLKQMFRELLLLQSSDWPFLVTTGQAKDYAVQRFQGHLTAFRYLAQMLEDGRKDVTLLQQLHDRDPIFDEIDPQWYSRPQLPTLPEVAAAV